MSEYVVLHQFVGLSHILVINALAYLCNNV